ncbi:MAG: hypothetical protein GWN99_02115 [Gemmatimonadetes bacterium]|uniref:FtsX-like permease family protein n=1 Tax=Candidatus Kutchimonas denitrificans TaxID=3056748 RepID=A0AAE4Z8R0_9BACT|nr:hypothetical protein [Gemmatimonadota bacterium]NIR74241.1 hypothetical protein [Candidatus Kutchimonas denitrificans]NIR99863.1 hypothetical protein [Gemmatimonadota bacterium]NIT65452.1 hypothetical protein [Gemmatimonadota bacterium]NIU51817.1 hypothetical protein [Gemmatimonadota bacterium]
MRADGRWPTALPAFPQLALLGAVGVYGVSAFAIIGQRTQEVGIRLALGARTVEVLRLMIARELRAPLAKGDSSTRSLQRTPPVAAVTRSVERRSRYSERRADTGSTAAALRAGR